MQTSQVLLFVVKNEKKKFEKTFNHQIFQHACTNVPKMYFTNQYYTKLFLKQAQTGDFVASEEPPNQIQGPLFYK